MSKSPRKSLSKKKVAGKGGPGKDLAVKDHAAKDHAAKDHAANPFKRVASAEAGDDHGDHVVMRGVRCETESVGHGSPQGRSPLEIVVDASEGFIPLWAKDTTLRWKFRDSSFRTMADPAAAKSAVERLFGRALLKWGDAAPVKFAKKDDAWDFEIVMKRDDDCDSGGCVLASAFFPDGGRHQLFIYPKMLEQDQEEQIETLIHEIGHIFGLRHFFAIVQEKAWPAKVFGTHDKFTIMNYGEDSKLTPSDKADLKRLYQLAWSGQLTHINKTPIRFMKPYHASGTAAGRAVAIAAVVQPEDG